MMRPPRLWMWMVAVVVVAAALSFSAYLRDMGPLTCPDGHCPDSDSLEWRTAEKRLHESAPVTAAYAFVGFSVLGIGFVLGVSRTYAVFNSAKPE